MVETFWPLANCNLLPIIVTAQAAQMTFGYYIVVSFRYPEARCPFLMNGMTQRERVNIEHNIERYRVER